MAGSIRLAEVARGFNRLSGRDRLTAMAGVAMLIAVAVGAGLWGTTPEYRVLYASVSDRDGGAVVAALDQMNVPYRFSEGGGAILVPAGKVHDVRLRLASQGLPRGGAAGFELMENQKLGATQFQEQVNYQRALEGELARSIQTLSAVSAARVHLAIPKPSVFLREQQKPSASIIVTLHAGRSLERAQVAGIAHLVSASIPELPLRAVSVLDQHGNLLSSAQDAASGLDPAQLTYVQSIEAATMKRIGDILEPITGRGNLRVQVTAELDFSRSESSSETYKPNPAAQGAAIRSETRNESSDPVALGPQGVPGAASNQPGAANAAPVPAQAGTQVAASRKESSVAYEVDKTVRHVKDPVGAVKRLSAAVVVNHRKGKALSAEEMAQIAALAKEAMGFSEARGDSINIANAPFSVEEREVAPPLPWWKQPENLAMAMDAGKLLAAVLAILYVLFGVLRPMLRSLAQGGGQGEMAALPEPAADEAVVGHQQRLAAARSLAKSDPKVVANVVKTWVAQNE